jgi:EVE domain
MTYWLGVVTPEVWKEARQQEYDPNGPRLYGFPRTRRKSVHKIKAGDRIIDYLTKRKVFFAAWEVTGEHSYDPSRKFAGKEFPECVEVTPIKTLSPEMGIQNNWIASVRMSARPLDDDVGEPILKALQNAG